MYRDWVAFNFGALRGSAIESVPRKRVKNSYIRHPYEEFNYTESAWHHSRNRDFESRQWRKANQPYRQTYIKRQSAYPSGSQTSRHGRKPRPPSRNRQHNTSEGNQYTQYSKTSDVSDNQHDTYEQENMQGGVDYQHHYHQESAYQHDDRYDRSHGYTPDTKSHSRRIQEGSHTARTRPRSSSTPSQSRRVKKKSKSMKTVKRRKSSMRKKGKRQRKGKNVTYKDSLKEIKQNSKRGENSGQETARPRSHSPRPRHPPQHPLYYRPEHTPRPTPGLQLPYDPDLGYHNGPFAPYTFVKDGQNDMAYRRTPVGPWGSKQSLKMKPTYPDRKPDTRENERKRRKAFLDQQEKEIARQRKRDKRRGRKPRNNRQLRSAFKWAHKESNRKYQQDDGELREPAKGHPQQPIKFELEMKYLRRQNLGYMNVASDKVVAEMKERIKPRPPPKQPACPPQGARRCRRRKSRTNRGRGRKSIGQVKQSSRSLRPASQAM